MNLLVNAKDAMPDGGTLVIRSSELTLGKCEAKLRRLTPGNYIVLTVEDSGIGMADATKEHIFEPFFTTKAVGRGTGLGLATVYGIVKQVSGAIRVESELGHGTTFTLYFPKSERTDPGRATEPSKGGGRYGTESVLIVDDDPVVRLAVRGYLELWGYSVHEAGDLAEVSLVLQRSGAVDLVIADVMLPGATLSQVVERIESQRPEALVILMSAYPRSLLEDEKRIPKNTTLLAKPFSEETLMSEVRRVLGEGSATSAPGSTEPGSRPATTKDRFHSGESSDSGWNGRTLLVVEDHEGSRFVTRDVLELASYKVLSARNATEAVKLCESWGGRVDAIVTDLGLPGISGSTLVQQMRTKFPNLSTIYISGRSERDIDIQRLLDVPKTTYLQKPININDLVERVKEMLATPHPEARETPQRV